MSAPYNAIEVAKYIINNTESPTNLRVQKLLYFAQGEKLASDRKPLFSNVIEKWRLGPVVPDVYHNYKEYGSSVIGKQQDLILRDGKLELIDFNENILSEEDKLLIKSIIDRYKSYDDFELVEETHKHPMWKNYEEDINAGFRHLEYSNKEISEYFKHER